MSNHLSTELANWDGSLSQQQPSSSSSSTSSVRKQPTSTTKDVLNLSKQQTEEEQRKQSATAVMPPPPLPRTPVRPTSHRTNQSSGHGRANFRRDSWSAMSVSSQSSFSNNTEDRGRVEGMLFELDDPSSPSSSKPEHHWQVPMDILSPNTAGTSSSAWPSHSLTPPSDSAQWSQVAPSPVFENHQPFPPVDFFALGAPVGVTPSLIANKISSPSTKDTSNCQEDEPDSEIPPSLSFSPSHYRISELPSILDEDVLIQSQPTTHTSVSEGVSVHPAFDTVEPLAGMSLLASLKDTTAQDLSPEIPLITPSPEGCHDTQSHMALQDPGNMFDLSVEPGGPAKTSTPTVTSVDERSRSPDSTLGTVAGSSQISGTEPPSSVSFLDRRSFDDGQSCKTTVVTNFPTPTPTPTLQRDMSIVPETPPTISPMSPQTSRFSQAQRSDSPMRVSDSASPDSYGDPRLFVSRSTDDSTLIDSQHVMHKTGKRPAMLPVLAGTREENDEHLDSSPLSSPPTSAKPLRSKRKVYVDVPPLPPHRKREDYRPISAYIHHMSTSDLQPTGQGSRSSGASMYKRKRSIDVARSPPAHTKRPRANTAKSTSPIVFSSWGEIGLESLGHDAYDALKPFCEYLEVDAGYDVESLIEERYTDVRELEEALRPVFRHLQALLFGAGETQQVMEEEAEKVDTVPLPGPAASQADDLEVPAERMVSATPQVSPRRDSHASPEKISQTTQPTVPSETQPQQPSQPHPLFHPNETQNIDVPSDQVTFPSLLQDTTLVQDHDAFLGVQEDHPYEDNHMLMQNTADMLIDSYNPPSSSSRLYGTSFTDPAYDYGHEGALFYSQDGTINPTLLAPPPILHHHFRTPSPSPQPSSPDMPLRASLSQVTASVFDNEETSSSSSSSSEEEEENEDGQKKKKSKDKGKERASGVGIRARQLLEEYEPGLRAVSQPRYGTRDRRPTVKAMEAMEAMEAMDHETREPSVSSYAGSTQRVTKKTVKSKKDWKEGREKRKTMGSGDPTYAGEYCHQCRNTNRYAKMRCSAIRENGEACLLLFCEKCILKRYSPLQVQFDLGLSDFVCPKCADYCNCTKCARNRGEVYVSTRHVTLGLETRTRLKARRKSKSKSKRTHSNSNSDFDYEDNEEGDIAYTEDGDGDSDIHISVPSALPVGGHFGAVYDLTGRKRIGVGIVADASSQRIVLVPNSDAGGPGLTPGLIPGLTPGLTFNSTLNPSLNPTHTSNAKHSQHRVNNKKTTSGKGKKGGKQFIGLARPIWRSSETIGGNEGSDEEEEDRDTGGRAYIGKRGPLFNHEAYKSVEEHVHARENRPRTPSGPGVEGEGEVEEEGGSPSKGQVLDSTNLQFTLATLLGIPTEPIAVADPAP